MAEGTSGTIFKKSSLLNVESKNCSLFIQSDKGIYKPGESLQFRVLVLDFNLKPVDLDESNLNVFITVNHFRIIFEYGIFFSVVIVFYIMFSNVFRTGLGKKPNKTMEKCQTEYGRVFG